MGKRIKRWFGALKTVGDLWWLVQFFSTQSVLSVMAFMAGWTTGELHWALFTACGVFAFVTLVIYYGQLLFRGNTIFRRFIPFEFVLAGAGPGNKPNTSIINMQVNLINTSQKIIYMTAKRTSFQIAGRTPENPQSPSTPFAFVPGVSMGFGLASVEIPNQVASVGKVELELYYGSSPDNLKYLLIFEGTPHVSMHFEGNEVKGVQFVGSSDKVEHQRAAAS